MRHAFVARSVIAGLALLACASVARAQTEEVRVDVPFAFKAGGTSFEPGQYTLRADDLNMTVELVPAHGRTYPLLVETRLGGTGLPPSEGRLVFDKVGDLRYLAEVWVPGMDGYLLMVTKGAHRHVHVKFGPHAS